MMETCNLVRPRAVASAASIVVALVVGACGDRTPPPRVPAPSASSAATVAPPAPSTSASTGDLTASMPKAAVRYTGFAGPECVLYDAANDRYLVSNVNGHPRNTDNDGFISALSPDGAVTNPKWIEGGKNGVRLDAPKGMAITGGVLYVADIRVVRMFDLASGAPKGEIAIPNATYLNDVVASPDGRVFVSDSGLKTHGAEFDATNTDAIWEVTGAKARALVKTPALHQPNGMAWDNGSLVVVAFGANVVYRVDMKGQITDETKLPTGKLDGVVVLPGDVLLITSGDVHAIYRGKLGGAFDVALPGQLEAADIGYDTKRGRVLVPRAADHAVEAHDLK